MNYGSNRNPKPPLQLLCASFLGAKFIASLSFTISHLMTNLSNSSLLFLSPFSQKECEKLEINVTSVLGDNYFLDKEAKIFHIEFSFKSIKPRHTKTNIVSTLRPETSLLLDKIKKKSEDRLPCRWQIGILSLGYIYFSSKKFRWTREKKKTSKRCHRLHLTSCDVKPIATSWLDSFSW